MEMKAGATSSKRTIATGLAAMIVVMLLGMGPLFAPRAFADGLSNEGELPETITVQFKQGIGVLGAVPDATPDMTINAAFVRTGASRPIGGGSESEFKGWAASPTASKPLKNYLTIAAAYEQSGNDGILILYPVFGPVSRPHLSFYGQDGTTLLSEGDIDSWQTLDEVKLAPDISVVDDVSQLPALRKLGYCFMGWADEDGALCYSDEPIVEDTSFAAHYAKLDAVFAGIKGASADVSNAFLLRSDVEKAVSTGFRLEKASGIDARLASAAKSEGYRAFTYYRAMFGFTADGEMTLVKQDFGSVAVSLPTTLSDGTKVRVYWLSADGSVERTATSKVSKGVVSMSFSDYQIEATGNVAIAYDKSAASSKGTATKSNTGSGKNSKSNTAKNSGAGSKSGSGASSGSSGTSGSSSRLATGSGTQNTVNSRRSTSSSSLLSTIARPNTSSSSATTSTTAASSNSSDDDDSDTDDGAGAGGVGLSEESEGLDESSEGVSVESDLDGDADSASLVDESLAAQNTPIAQAGSKDGGVFYGAAMFLIAAIAAAAWWLVFKRGNETVGESAISTAPTS